MLISLTCIVSTWYTLSWYLDIDFELLGFDLTMTFHTLYKSFCIEVLWMFYDFKAFVEYQSCCIKNHMKIKFFTLAQYFKSSVQLHQDTFKDKHLQWVQLKTNTTCLFCFMSKIWTCAELWTHSVQYLCLYFQRSLVRFEIPLSHHQLRSLSFWNIDCVIEAAYSWIWNTLH